MPPIDRKTDENVLAQLESLGINTENAQKQIEMKKHNHITASYYLLAKKFLNKTGKIDKNGGYASRDAERPLTQTSKIVIPSKGRGRIYSVTPPKGNTDRIYTKPKEPTLPKPTNMPKKLSKLYVGTRLYMKNDNKSKDLSTTTNSCNKSPNVTQNINDYSFG